MTAAARRRRAGLTPAQALARIRDICLSLPEASEKEAWGAPTFRAGGKLFVMFVNDHHGDGRLAIWCHGAAETQRGLVEADPERFFVPPYVGKGGWIGIRLDRRPSWAVVAALVEEGHRRAMPKRRAAKPAGRAGGARARRPARGGGGGRA